MIADLKPYSEYKDSGLPWLGQVPGHWNIRRVKLLLREVDSRSTTGKEQLLRVSQFTGVTQRKSADGSDEPDTRAASLVGYKRVCSNDLVINIMLAWNGSMGVSRHEGIASPAYCVYRFNKDALPWYYHELLRLPVYKGRIKVASTGVVESRLRLYSEELGRVEAILPPLNEQAAIVRFLDYATHRLDKAIRAKRKTIALLNEQKQAIIHRAVTRGLPSTGSGQAVLLKDSGIPWLGQIPAHWEVRRLRTLVHSIDQGVSPLAVGFLAEGDSWGVLKSGCVNRGVFRETEHKQLARSFEIDPSIVVKVGDVLISRACGSPSLVGSVGRIRSLRYQLILSDKTFRAFFRDCVDVDFMVFAMNCRYYRHQVEQAISGADGMANNLPLSSLKVFSVLIRLIPLNVQVSKIAINLPKNIQDRRTKRKSRTIFRLFMGEKIIKGNNRISTVFCFAIPPKNEAAAISAYLDSETSGVQKSVTILEREIELLREYRTCLIADVVTGKLDVREAATRLPEVEGAPADEPALAALGETDDELAEEEA